MPGHHAAGVPYFDDAECRLAAEQFQRSLIGVLVISAVNVAVASGDVFFGSPKIEAIIGHRRSPVVGGSARPQKGGDLSLCRQRQVSLLTMEEAYA
jgi:hypothetical protein